jgi:hypothetical protein
MSRRRRSSRLMSCHPNFLMNVSHAAIVASNPEARGTLFSHLSDQSIAYWTGLAAQCRAERETVFYQEANAIMLSYSRAISGAYRIWKSEIEMAHRQFETSERQMTNVKVLLIRVGVRILESLAKLLMVMVFGYVLALFLDKAFVPAKVAEATGVRLPATLGALSLGLVSMVASAFYSNKLWSSAAAELSWCLGAAEEELERASIDAFDIHWSQFCRAYRDFTGKDYVYEPSFISIMRGKLRARERWNQRRLYRLTGNARFAIALAKRRLWAIRTRYVAPQGAPNA